MRCSCPACSNWQVWQLISCAAPRLAERGTLWRDEHRATGGVADNAPATTRTVVEADTYGQLQRREWVLFWCCWQQRARRGARLGKEERHSEQGLTARCTRLVGPQALHTRPLVVDVDLEFMQSDAFAGQSVKFSPRAQADKL